MKRRFPFKPGTWVRIHWKDAVDRDGTLAEVKREGLIERRLAGKYMGCTSETFIFCSDFCKRVEEQTFVLIPRDWVDLDRVEKT